MFFQTTTARFQISDPFSPGVVQACLPSPETYVLIWLPNSDTTRLQIVRTMQGSGPSQQVLKWPGSSQACPPLLAQEPPLEQAKTEHLALLLSHHNVVPHAQPTSFPPEVKVPQISRYIWLSMLGYSVHSPTTDRKYYKKKKLCLTDHADFPLGIIP